MLITFWGVRGSIPCPEPTHMRAGGNTSCVGVSVAGREFLFDAGTGLRAAGRHLLQNGKQDYTILLGHTHHDHISGFPFFMPAYQPGTRIQILAGHLASAGGVRQIFADQMSAPLFPVRLDGLKANLSFEDFNAGDTIDAGDGISIRTIALNHPGGATGYRLDYNGKSICYVTDTEHEPEVLDKELLALVQDTDLLVYDSTYTDEEFEQRRGWGHSSWEHGVRISQAAQVKNYVLFHHDPDHDDIFLDEIEKKAKFLFPGSILGREGLKITL